MAYFDMTVPQDMFSIDNQPTKVIPKLFNGKELDLICFVDAETGAVSQERSASIETFCFNGTAILTPSAFNEHLSFDVHDINEECLEGNLLVIELEKGIAYGSNELRQLLHQKEIVDESGEKEGTGKKQEKYIVLFKTGLMDQILAASVKEGKVDYEELARIQENRPGITADGARYLSHINIAKAFAVDNISFETNEGSVTGFAATQILMNGNNNYVCPLVYHVAKTTDTQFEYLVKKSRPNIYPHVMIQLGNVPSYKLLPGYPVAFKVQI